MTKIKTCQDHIEVAKKAALQIADLIKKKPNLKLGLATGSTMEPLYAELIRMHKEEALDFSKISFFNLDNYIGLAPDDRNNYANQLHLLFLNHINANPDNIHLVSSKEDFSHISYENKIKELGGIDIQLLGIGSEGHIAFNEVGSKITSKTRKVKLSDRTLFDNSKSFNNLGEKIPHFAHTMGIATILDSKEIILLINGYSKANTLKNMLEKGNIEDLPARALNSHNKVSIIADEEALAMLSKNQLDKYTDLSSLQKEILITKNQSPTITIFINGKETTLTLSPEFDFYDPANMQINEKFDYKNPKHLKLLANTLGQTTDISVGGHPDDAEIMAAPMMIESKNDPSKEWLSIIITSGAATSNTLNGVYSQYTPKELTKMRQSEQRQAAREANVPVIMYKFPTANVNGYMGKDKLKDAQKSVNSLFKAMHNLKIVYGHNPFDIHDTHLRSLDLQINALRNLDIEHLNQIKIYGMEVWGNIFTPQSHMIKVPIKDQSIIDKSEDIIRLYKSQLEGQDRDYAKATAARIVAHGGYQTHPHGASPPAGVMIGIDLSDFVKDKNLDLHSISMKLIDGLKAEQNLKLAKFSKSTNEQPPQSHVDKINRNKQPDPFINR